MTDTYHDVALESLLGAWRNSAVADEAGVDAVAWASTSSPRVCSGNRGWIAGRHRGRLPLVEIYQESDDWTKLTNTGGLVTHRWRIRVYVGQNDVSLAESQARAILYVGLAVLRSIPYWYVGEEATEALEAHPLGHSLDCVIVTEHAACRETFETGVVVDPGEGVVVIPGPGGYTMVCNWNCASPKAIYTIPLGQALDNVECHVLTAWDGTGASLQIGIAGDADKYMSLTAAELTVAGRTYEQDFGELGPISLIATIDPGTASQGSVRIQVTVTKSGS